MDSVFLEKVEKKPLLPKCPYCKTCNLQRITVFDQRGPPASYHGDTKVLSKAIGTQKINFMGKVFCIQSKSFWRRKTIEKPYSILLHKKRGVLASCNIFNNFTITP